MDSSKDNVADVADTPTIIPQNLTKIIISNENIALNVIVGFINIAQRRGAFSFDESAKIHECIIKFQKEN